jgi:neutral ceramidase
VKQRYVSFNKVLIEGEYGDFMGGFDKRPAGPPPSPPPAVPPTPLHARCLVIWDDQYANIIVCADVLGISNAMRGRILTRVTTLIAALRPNVEFGGKGDFVLAATHTHKAPAVIDVQPPYIMWGLAGDDLAKVAAYSTRLEDRIMEAIQGALDHTRKKECTLEYGTGSTGVAKNRSDTRADAWKETAVPILIARSTTPEKTPIAVLFGYGCHPLSDVGKWWDSEYPGRACRLLEEEWRECQFALFLQGASGDQAPKEQDADNGTTLATVVRGVLSKTNRPINGSIQSSVTMVQLPVFLPDEEELKAAYTARCGSSDPPLKRHAEVMLRKIPGSYREPVMLPVIVWHFMLPLDTPPLKIVFIGGELVSGYAKTLRTAIGENAHLMIVAYANGMPGYVPTDDFLPPKTAASVTYPNYEGGWNDDTPRIAGTSQIGYGQFARYLTNGEVEGRDGLQKTLDRAILTAVTTLPGPK